MQYILAILLIDCHLDILELLSYISFGVVVLIEINYWDKYRYELSPDLIMFWANQLIIDWLLIKKKIYLPIHYH